MLKSRLQRTSFWRPRDRTPLLLQMEAVECGAACLGIILAHFGRFEELGTLRVACGVSRDGANAASILKAAAQFGCETRGYKASQDEVLEGPFPVILFWNYNHFVVLEGARGDRVFLNDPATGHRMVTRAEFGQSFSGVVLSIQPGTGFEPSETPPKPGQRLLRETGAYRLQLGFLLFVGALIALPGFVIPNIAGIYVDNILLETQSGWLWPLLTTLIAATLALALLSWVKNGVLLRVGAHMTAAKSAEFLWRVLRLPKSFFELRYQGEIASRISSVNTISQLISSQIGAAVLKLFSACILFALMFAIEPLLAALAVSGALLNAAVLRALHRRRYEAALRLSIDEGKLFSSSVIGIRTMETLKASAREDDFFGQWAGYHARALNSEQVLSRIEQLSALVPMLIATLTTAAALYLGGAQVMNAALTLGALIAFQALFAASSAPVQQMVETVGQMQQSSADLMRLDDALTHDLDWRHRGSSIAAGAKHSGAAHLQIDAVTYGYTPQGPALIETFSLDLQPGRWTALVGASGSGKSTISKLACGLYTPWAGQVRIDGQTITEISRDRLATRIGAVAQDITLFEASARDNLSLWDPELSQEALEQAARDAQLLDLINKDPSRFEQVIDENGRNLSGGERQRFEIARALVRCPSLLVLDEATSALDPATELQILQAVRRRGISCLLVAHRLSTIRNCDEIIVLEQGQIAQRGQHDALIAEGGAYRRLIEEGRDL